MVIGLIVTIIALFSAIYFTRQNAVNQTSDTYKDFNDLKHHTTQNKDWKISTKHVKNDNILITAIHGGGIEPGSTEIARRIANIGKYDFYSFQDYYLQIINVYILLQPIMMNLINEYASSYKKKRYRFMALMVKIHLFTSVEKTNIWPKRFALNCAKLALLLSLALKELKQCRKIILLIKMALIQVCN